MSTSLELFFDRLLNKQGDSPTPNCLLAFDEHFSGATSIEWSKHKLGFETTFYRNNLEHLALFEKDGNLIEYRMTLPEGFLPHSVKLSIEEKGEIMNRVMINKGNAIEYEVIYRDAELKRFLVLLSDLGEVIGEKVL